MPTRPEKLAALRGRFDVLVLGGGATGLGIAVDAATRGYRTVLVEAGDFAQATSSRSTKLVHGGVRYLASGQLSLVYEALRERMLMWRHAAHLVRPQAFITPAYRWRDLPWYGAGLKLYDLLSGKSSLGPTKILSARETRRRIPGIVAAGLKGSVLYHDGQFDDARFALVLARTAEDRGALVLNYVRCTELLKEDGKLTGAEVVDEETGQAHTVRAAAVMNATGIFVDSIRRMDAPGMPELLSVSRGTHLVVAGDFLGGEDAIMVPKTADGRIIFAIPWLGRVVIGTTDLRAKAAAMEPGHELSEVDFLLETIRPYLLRPIRREDILSVYSGLRPLVTGKGTSTAKLSREHHIDLSAGGLITIAGGKWTTYRRMAEETLDFAIRHGLLEAKPCVSREVALRGAPANGQAPSGPLAQYGTDAPAVQLLADGLAEGQSLLDPALPYTVAEVIYAVREEFARTVEDVLSHRTRALLLDARAAVRAAPWVARILAAELHRDQAWADGQGAAFADLARRFYGAAAGAPEFPAGSVPRPADVSVC